MAENIDSTLMDVPQKRHVEEFLDLTQGARIASERDRDYKDNKQWTQEQVAKLKARRQAPVVDNRIKPKVEGLKGLLINRRTDPHAYPRTQKHEKAAEAATDALRFVADNTDLDSIELEVADNIFVEGYGGAVIQVRKNKKHKGEVEVTITQIPWDRIYYDPHSRRSDFKDAKYMGIVMWMDKDEAMRMFPDKKDVVQNTINNDGGGIDETFEDRPSWRESRGGDDEPKRERIRVAEEYYMNDGVWYTCIFTGRGYLKDPKPSPFLDEEGQPSNPIELQGAYIDRDNNRFGEVRYFIDMQDEINHRRSKFLHFLSVRQTFGTKGNPKDVEKRKRELKKPDGHVVFEGGEKFGKDFGILPTTDMAEAQFTLLQDARAEMDSTSFNAQLAGERQKGDLSGRAILALQQAGTLELSSLYNGIKSWKQRVYRQIWNRISQYWTKEKWVRVTDDQNKLRWVGLNTKITLRERLEEVINDESQDLLIRKQAAATYIPMIQRKDPGLEEIVEVRNKVAELDVDIILEQKLDVVNIQQEQFLLLAQLAANRPEIPFTALLRMSELRDKEELIREIEEAQQAGQKALEAQSQMEGEKHQVEVDKGKQDIIGQSLQNIQTQLENINLANSPDENPQVNV